MKRNVYSCLMFRERPDLHMTLKYRKNVDDHDAASWYRGILGEVGELQPFDLVFDTVRMLGRGGQVRTLTCSRAQVPLCIAFPLVTPSWVPHVTCDDEPPLRLTATHAALCHRKEILYSVEFRK